MTKKTRLPKLNLTERQEQAIKVLLDNGLLPDLIEGLDHPVEPENAHPNDTAVMAEYREMFPGRTDEELEMLAQTT